MASYTQTYAERATVHGAPATQGTFSALASDAFSVSLTQPVAYGLTVVDSPVLSASAAYKWTAGAALVETALLHAAATPETHYSVTLSDLVRMTQAQRWAQAVALIQGLSVGDAAKAALGVFIIERAKLLGLPTTTATYHVLLTQALRISETLANFFNISMTEMATLQGSASPVYLAVAQVLDHISIQDVNHDLTHLVFNITLTDDVDITDDQLLKMIYAGELTDGLQLSALYVSPQGNVSTWAINTRTNAITEYQNWVFNSFAAMGRKYLGAAADGLYELQGARDGSNNIVAAIRSGLLQFNSGKLSGIKGVYIGMRGQGQYLLKIDNGDGRDYTYQFKSQPALMTTKVNIGKGLNTRYMGWELISTGPDFDLDSIEFVPMMRSRRV